MWLEDLIDVVRYDGGWWVWLEMMDLLEEMMNVVRRDAVCG